MPSRIFCSLTTRLYLPREWVPNSTANVRPPIQNVLHAPLIPMFGLRCGNSVFVQPLGDCPIAGARHTPAIDLIYNFDTVGVARHENHIRPHLYPYGGLAVHLPDSLISRSPRVTLADRSRRYSALPCCVTLALSQPPKSWKSSRP